MIYSKDQHVEWLVMVEVKLMVIGEGAGIHKDLSGKNTALVRMDDTVNMERQTIQMILFMRQLVSATLHYSMDYF